MPDAVPIVSLREVILDYRGLRPLRIRDLDVGAGECVALLGFDVTTADILVGLITGSCLPDSGDVRVLGPSTRVIDTADAWLGFLDRFGLVGDRTVLVERLTIEENLAISLSLDVAGMPDEIRTIVHSVAAEVGLSVEALSRPVEGADPFMRALVRLGRALAPDPAVLIVEHATVGMPADSSRAFAGRIAAIGRMRRIATVVITADEAFAHAVSQRVLRLQPATGELTPVRRRRGWFT